MNIQQFKEKNSVIARTINELHQEVSDALEERIALEYQLEQIKSFGE
jgi:FtsZ-binding cell division protein ZapB